MDIVNTYWWYWFNFESFFGKFVEVFCKFAPYLVDIKQELGYRNLSIHEPRK
jgi:hypothetical protein